MTYRVVVVPAHARRVWLHFSYRAIGAAQRGSPGQSWLEVDVLSPRSHRALARILRVALVPADRGWPWDRERTAPGPWHHVTVDLTHFRGRRVWLCFRVDHRRGVAPALVDVSGLRITTH